jgi:hypothetical protein
MERRAPDERRTLALRLERHFIRLLPEWESVERRVRWLEDLQGRLGRLAHQQTALLRRWRFGGCWLNGCGQ